MRFLMKILFAPVIAVLAVVVWILAAVLSMTAWVFGLAGYFLLFWDWG